MNWANIGKKIVKAKQLGKNLNEVNLGKYEPTTKAKRDKLAKVAKVYKKGMGTKTAKKVIKNPEHIKSKHTFLTRDDQKKMGTPGEYYLPSRKKGDYKKGGTVKRKK
tara:strand:+ start:98 stop:418 length:321 start_codon:yes stop_codon:yes gene_type:complete